MDNKKMIMTGAGITCASLIIMVAASATAANIAQADKCDKYPAAAHSTTTGVAVLSALGALAGAGILAFGVYKAIKGGKGFVPEEETGGGYFYSL